MIQQIISILRVYGDSPRLSLLIQHKPSRITGYGVTCFCKIYHPPICGIYTILIAFCIVVTFRFSAIPIHLKSNSRVIVRIKLKLDFERFATMADAAIVNLGKRPVFDIFAIIFTITIIYTITVPFSVSGMPTAQSVNFYINISGSVHIKR